MMIKAELFAEQGRLTGFHISGHSGYDEEGKDILEGLKLHLMNTEEQYPEFLQVIFTEV